MPLPSALLFSPLHVGERTVREPAINSSQALTSPHKERGVRPGGDLAELSQFTIVTYERRPGAWRAAMTPIKRSGAFVPGRTTFSMVTPDDFTSESDAKFAAEKIIRKL